MAGSSVSRLRLDLMTSEIRDRLDQASFDYIDLQVCEALYYVPIGRSGWICVFGDPNNAAYEWVFRREVRADTFNYEWSNNGCASIAETMRAGLNAALDH
jgi:hypothetical protein